MKLRILFLACTACLLLAACRSEIPERPGVHTNSIMEMKDKWLDKFTLEERNRTPQLPQTRYCYTTQSDIVCYDSPQANMTAELNGYQDGANISGFQPGGGSLGVSGGEPTAMYSSPQVQAAPQTQVVSQPVMVQSTGTMPPGSPFYVGESPYQKGAVSSRDLPPAR